MAQPGVMIYYSYIDPVMDELDMQARGELLTAIISYSKSGVIPPTVSGMTRLAFASIRSYIDKDRETYEEKVLHRRYATWCREAKRNGLTEIPYEEWKASLSVPDNRSTSHDDCGHQVIPSDTSTHQVVSHDDFDDQKHPITMTMTIPMTMTMTECRDTKTIEGAPSISEENDSGIRLALADGSVCPVTNETLDRWQKRYPTLDMLQQFRKMEGWLEVHPERRKSRKDLGAFVQSWLSRELADAKGKEPAKKFDFGVNGGIDDFMKDAISRMLADDDLAAASGGG